ncbi:MAG: hypothetical protein Q4D42_02250 [Eubacteriales bacterium]|nr:hypothetical protein [Eubacteriales bacterium]
MTKGKVVLAAVVGLLMIAAAILYHALPSVSVDFSQELGDIKEINGINNGPKSNYSESENGQAQWALDATDLYRELGIPCVRTHDTEFPYGGEAFVDIHCIFPDWSQSADDPSAYHFAETDLYIQNILDSGAKVLFRLGESISPSENDIRYTYPPEDKQKWAEICWHIVSHYNHGWADGFYDAVAYWEIWNEPDVYRQWSGDIDEYYALYQTTARYLKGKDPELIVGGGALGDASEQAITAFLQGITDDGEDTPLDFFSWHCYSSKPDIFLEQATVVRDTLDRSGFTETQSFLDEWNYVADWEHLESTWEVLQSTDAAAFYAQSLICMQNAPIDQAMYYDGAFVSGVAEWEGLAEWCGLYDADGNKLPGYYAFAMFHALQEAGTQVEAETDVKGLYCCAAKGDRNGILLVNSGSEAKRFLLKLSGDQRDASITRVNRDHPDGVTEQKNWMLGVAAIRMEAGEVLYISLE